jgi:hypothetical protein
VSDRYRDFDQFFAEMQREPLRLRLFGEDHELPPAVPAALVVEYHAIHTRQATEVVGDDQIFGLFSAIFGHDRTANWYARGLDVEQMVHLIGWAMEQYGAGAKGTDSPNALGPAKTPRGKRAG